MCDAKQGRRTIHQLRDGGEVYSGLGARILVSTRKSQETPEV